MLSRYRRLFPALPNFFELERTPDLAVVRGSLEPRSRFLVMAAEVPMRLSAGRSLSTKLGLQLRGSSEYL